MYLWKITLWIVEMEDTRKKIGPFKGHILKVFKHSCVFKIHVQ